MSKISKSHRDLAKTVERMGVLFEQSGYTPMHGRVFAYLLLAEPPHQDFYTIQEFLKASKSAISNALKFLTKEGIVEYITFSGDRKRYFKVDVRGWLENTKERIRQATDLKVLIADVLEIRKDTRYLAFNDELQDVVNFHNELAEVLKAMAARWDEQQRNKKSAR